MIAAAGEDAEAIKADGVALLRVARELRAFITDAPSTDPEAQSLLRDCDTLERVGRWLHSTSPIQLPVTLNAVSLPL